MSIIHPAELFDMTQTGFRRLSVPEGQGLGVFEGAAYRELGSVESGRLDGIFHHVDFTSGSRERNLLALPNGLELSGAAQLRRT